MTHVIPINDLKPHEPTEECWCFPLVVPDLHMVTHNAKDCRERFERQNRPTRNGWEIVKSDE